MTDYRALALTNEILRGVVGSTAHGTALEGTDDRDEMGICIEPPEYVMGLNNFDQYIYRTQPEGVRSGPGDLDLTIYSLRKWCALGVKGNPSTIMLLWLPEYITKTALGEDLIALRQAFVSRDAGWRYLGYLTAQRAGLTGERTKKVSRPDVVAKYGYDTKFAMHALRLGLQGIEYLSEGCISMPVREPDLTYLRSVRKGELPLERVLQDIDQISTRLRTITEACTRTADLRAINNFLIQSHQRHWQEYPH